MTALRTAGKRFMWLGIVAIVCALALVHPHLARHYALYLGSSATPSTAHLFLDPYPTLAACTATVAVFSANSEAAFCSGRLDLEFDGSADAVLAADFASFIPRAWYCKPPQRHT